MRHVLVGISKLEPLRPLDQLVTTRWRAVSCISQSIAVASSFTQDGKQISLWTTINIIIMALAMKLEIPGWYEGVLDEFIQFCCDNRETIEAGITEQ